MVGKHANPNSKAGKGRKRKKSVPRHAVGAAATPVAGKPKARGGDPWQQDLVAMRFEPVLPEGITAAAMPAENGDDEQVAPRDHVAPTAEEQGDGLSLDWDHNVTADDYLPETDAVANQECAAEDEPDADANFTDAILDATDTSQEYLDWASEELQEQLPEDAAAEDQLAFEDPVEETTEDVAGLAFDFDSLDATTDATEPQAEIDNAPAISDVTAGEGDGFDFDVAIDADDFAPAASSEDDAEAGPVVQENGEPTFDDVIAEPEPEDAASNPEEGSIFDHLVEEVSANPVRERHSRVGKYKIEPQNQQQIVVSMPTPVFSVSLPPVPPEWASPAAPALPASASQASATPAYVDGGTGYDEHDVITLSRFDDGDEAVMSASPPSDRPRSFVDDRPLHETPIETAKGKKKKAKEPLFVWRGKPIGGGQAEPEPHRIDAPRAVAMDDYVPGAADVEAATWLDQSAAYALSLGASDLHLAMDGRTQVLNARIRIDGTMRHLATISPPISEKIIGLFKVNASISSSGSFVPEESVYSLNVGGEARKARNVTFRDATNGIVAVLRLPPTGQLRRLEDLEMEPSNLELFKRMLAASNKLLMIAGPMGSGKTTTAHAALLQLASPERSVWTLEDPVERDLPGMTQLEIDEDNGATFATYLPTLVRSDYDTLFLGEIRDNATASAAIRQAKAGRQVISTIHANNNVTALLRLIELAEDSPLSVLDGVLGVISQRLVRKLNPDWDGVDPMTKYSGRIPIHEVLLVNDSIIELVMRNAPLSEVKAAAAMASESTFARDSTRLVNAGVTDWEEIYRVLGEAPNAE